MADFKGKKIEKALNMRICEYDNGEKEMKKEISEENIQQLIKQFEENGYIEAKMSLGDLTKFLQEFGYEEDLDEELPPIESPITIYDCGGIRYFSGGQEIVIAYNE